MPYLLCVRVADKCFGALWIEVVSCHQSTKGSSAVAPPPRFLVVSYSGLFAILDRLVHNAHHIALQGESLRKKRGPRSGKENA